MNRLLTFLISLSVLFVALQSSGQKLWDKIYFNSYPAISLNGLLDVAYCWDTAHGGLIAYRSRLANNKNTTIYLRLNSNGDTVWTRNNLFNLGSGESATGICRMPNGDFIIVAICDTPGSSITSHLLKRIDSLGNDVFNTTITPNVLNDQLHVISSGSGYVVTSAYGFHVSNNVTGVDSLVGKMRILKFNSANIRTASDSIISGGVYTFFGSNPPCNPSTVYSNWYSSITSSVDLQKCADGGYFTLCYRDTSIHFSLATCSYASNPGVNAGGLVCKHDSALHVKWCTNISTALALKKDSVFIPQRSFPTSDSGLVVIGEVLDSAMNYGNWGSVVVKLDKAGALTDVLRTPPWIWFDHGTETSNGQYLLQTDIFSQAIGVGWIQGLTLFDKHFGFVRYSPHPLGRFNPFPYDNGHRLFGLTANQYGGAFAPYFKDTSVEGYHQNLIPASVNFDSALNNYPAFVSGKVLRDNNQNCLYDPGIDRPQAARICVLTDSSTGSVFYTSTDPQGNWRRSVPLGTYDATHRPAPNTRIECPAPGYKAINLTKSSALLGYHFYDTLHAQYVDMKVLLSSMRFVPGFTSKLYSYVFNHGGSATSDTFRIVKPSALTYVSSNPAPVSVSGNMITWVLNNVAADSVVTMVIDFSVPASTTIGTSLSFAANIKEPQDANPYNNSDTLKTNVVGSFDPNCKTVNRPLYTSPRKDWVYTIEFQNTGNYPAKDVMIEDRFHPLLDVSTLRILRASHGTPTLTWGDGGQLFIHFEDINLPDSVHNEPGSHGFVSFSISPKASVKPGDSIFNNAGIFFDFNVPVYTDTAFNIISEPQLTVSTASAPALFTVFPNPSIGNLLIQSEVAGEALLIDMQGRVLYRFKVNQGRTSVRLPESLAAGIYVLQGRSSDGVKMGTLKMVLR